MKPVILSLLGSFQVMYEGLPITTIESERGRALLAYLAVEGDRPHRRELLGVLLWPDHPEHKMRENLRRVLYNLQQVFQPYTSGAPLLLVNRQDVQFNPAVVHWLDVAAFTQELAACQTHVHDRLTACSPCMARMAQAVAWYRGEFLAGFTLPGSTGFEEWRLFQQEALHVRMLDALTLLSAYHFQRRAYDQALPYLQRQIELEAWREEAHRLLMQVLAAQGQRNAALAQFETCRRTLAEQLGVEPEAETVALYEQIRDNKEARDKFEDRSSKFGVESDEATNHTSLSGLSSGTRFPHPAIVEWGDAPEANLLYGREPELAQLTAWLTGERCQLVAILGMGGIGKTVLAAKLARTLAGREAAPYDYILWHSLLNASPLTEVLRQWLLILSDHQLVHLPESVDAQFGLLFNYLRNRHCLLVLDNLESILETTGRAGQFRAGYEGYGQLIRRLGESSHQSCLLLTSRERPSGFALLEQHRPGVRSLPLAGLSASAGEQLLQSLSAASAAADRRRLIERYSGNPLALKVVAQTIATLFDGDVQAFLAEDALILDNIRDILDQQFARLAKLELALLLWLAIERAPVTRQTLKENLVWSGGQGEWLEALRALERRSLIETHTIGGQQHFTLQNVIMEYATERLIDGMCAVVTAHAETGRQEDKENFADPASLSPPLLVSLSLLNSHALLKAQATEHIRQSQARLIVQPVATRLLTRYGRSGLEARLKRILITYQAEARLAPGYAGGNLLNLLLHLGLDLQGYDFSGLAIWQAHLQGVILAATNFASAHFAHCTFTDTLKMVFDVAFSPGRPGARLLAVAMDNGQIRLWRTTDGQPVAAFQGHAGEAWAVAFSPNGQWLASGGADALIHLWDLTNIEMGSALRPDKTVGGHSAAVRALAFSPDGATLASASADHTVCLWELASVLAAPEPAPAYILHGHTDRVFCLAFSPDGATLASAGVDQVIRLWDLHALRAPAAERALCRLTLLGHTERIAKLAFSPDGRTLASASVDQTVRLWDTASGQCAQTLRHHHDFVLSVAFSPDGTLLATASHDKTVRLCDAHTGEVYRTLLGHTRGVWALAFSPEGTTLASGGLDHQLRLWGVRTGECQQVLQGVLARVRSVALATDGATFASAGQDGLIRLWDLQHPGPSRCCAILSANTYEITSLAFCPNRPLLASGGEDHAVRLWDVASQPSAFAGRCRYILQAHTHWVLAVTFSPDGRLLASSGHDGAICLWALADAEALALSRPLHTWQGEPQGIYALAFSPDGSLLASSGDDGLIRIWEVQSRTCRCVLPSAEGRVNFLVFSPDGTVLASAHETAVVCLWDIGAGQRLHRLHGHTQSVSSLAFSPDGSLLASGSADQTIRLWAASGVDMGQCRQVLHGHLLPITSLVFHPSAGAADQRQRRWDDQAVGHFDCAHCKHFDPSLQFRARCDQCKCGECPRCG